MKTVFVLLALFLATACQSSNNDKSAPAAPAAKENSKVVDTTPYSDCDRGTPAYKVQGVWKKNLESNGLQTEMTLAIYDGYMMASAHCSMQGRSLAAKANSRISITATEFSILDYQDDKQIIDEPNFKMDCNVNLKPIRFQYSFRGSCLVLKPENYEAATFIPAR